MEETDDQADTVSSDIKPRRRMPIEQREEVRRLLFDGVSRRQIAKRMGVSSSVIWRLQKKLQETGTVVDRHGGGRPRLAHQPSEHWIQLDGDYKFQCKHCDKLFVHHAQIREHLRTHTGERPFKCDQCFQAFATTSTLKRHLVKHTDIRPFMCDFCAKQFADNGSLRVHLRVHTGDKPYKCTHCDRRCITRGNLNAHMRTHMNITQTLSSEARDRGRSNQYEKKTMALLHDSSEEESSDNKMDQLDFMEEKIKNSVSVGDIINNEEIYTGKRKSEIAYGVREAARRTCRTTNNHDRTIGNSGNEETVHGKIASNNYDTLSRQGRVRPELQSDDKMCEHGIKTEIELD